MTLTELPTQRRMVPARGADRVFPARRAAPHDAVVVPAGRRTEPAAPHRTARLPWLMGVSIVAHVALAVMLAQITVSRSQPAPLPAVIHLSPVRILPVGDPADAPDAGSPMALADQATQPAGLLVAINHTPAPLPDRPFSPPLPVIGVQDDARLGARPLAAPTPLEPWTVAAAGAFELGTDALGTGERAGGKGRAHGRPAYLRNPRPPYPQIARDNGWEGTTVLRVEVLPTGGAGTVQVVQSSGHAVLDEVSVETVRRWRFVPAKLGDEKIVAWVEIPISFKLDRS